MKGQKSNPKNGHRRSSSRYNGAEEPDKLEGLFTRSVGKKCVITVSNGTKYEGVLSIVSTVDPFTIFLRDPVIVFGAGGKLQSKLALQGKDIVDVEIDDKPASKQASPQPASKFRTDTDISGGRVIKERELQRWVPDEDYPALELDDFESDNGTWDQFKVNEKKFGVESTYDEHLYTTRINTSAPDFQERVARAEKLAKEIESQTSSDRHVLEERGVVVDDSGLDEEDKYSGVDRRGDELMAALRTASISNESPSLSSSPGKYVPPRQRAAQYHNDPAIISSSAAPTKKPEAKEPLAKPDSVPPKPQVTQPHNESFRLNAQSEINSLREFSANF